MPRACVIVLDAVGAGALPDAEDYGDEGEHAGVVRDQAPAAIAHHSSEALGA